MSPDRKKTSAAPTHQGEARGPVKDSATNNNATPCAATCAASRPGSSGRRPSRGICPCLRLEGRLKDLVVPWPSPSRPSSSHRPASFDHSLPFSGDLPHTKTFDFDWRSRTKGKRNEVAAGFGVPSARKIARLERRVELVLVDRRRVGELQVDRDAHPGLPEQVHRLLDPAGRAWRGRGSPSRRCPGSSPTRTPSPRGGGGRHSTVRASSALRRTLTMFGTSALDASSWLTALRVGPPDRLIGCTPRMSNLRRVRAREGLELLGQAKQLPEEEDRAGANTAGRVPVGRVAAQQDLRLAVALCTPS